VFSSIINSSLINEKKSYKEQFPEVAESYWIVEEWNRTWDSGNTDIAYDMEIGASNNILITGRLDNGNDDDILIIKYDSLGNQIWNQTWGGNGDDFGCGIAEDSFGNIYVCAAEEGDSTGIRHLVVLKYDSSGNYIWNITYDDEPRKECTDIAIDEFNNLYIVGTKEKDLFLIKFDGNRNEIWNRTWGFVGKLDYLEEIKIDSNNDVIVGGRCYYEYPITNWRTILTKYNSSGSKLWEKFFGGTSACEFMDLTLDSNDNIYLCFLISHAYASVYIYDSNGSQIRYANLVQDGDTIRECYLHLDLNEYLYVFNTIDSSSPWHTTLYKLNNLLKREWKYSWIYDETNYEYAVEIAGDSNNNLYTTLISQKGSFLDIIITKFIPSPPLDPSISINNGDNVTYSNKVNLTLSAKGAKEMCFKNGSTGEWTNWEPYSTFKQLYLEGTVNNTGYSISVKYRNDIGESQISSDSIIYRTNLLIIKPNMNDFSVDLGEIGYLLSWNVKSSEKINDSYWITRNQSIITQGVWQHNSNISFYENEILPTGLYEYTCFINDTIGNIVCSSIYVKVNLIPYAINIRFPDNNVYIPNTEYEFNCSWFDDDGKIQKVKFEFNFKNYTVRTNHSGEYSYILSDLSANESGYKFRWHALDNNGAWNSTKLYTFILHKNNSQLLILFNGTKGDKIYLNNYIINITVINLNSTPGKLQLFINSQLVQETIGYSLTYISKFSIGDYNINVLLTHENYTGNSYNLLQIVRPPCFINQSEDFTMIEGDTFKEIFWTPYDENENYGSFWILRNGINIYDGSWSDSSILYSELYLLEPGFYNFTCFINNTYGFRNSSSIFVTILPNHCPNIFNTTNDITINIGTTGFMISWYTFDIDNNNFSYWIERNQELVEEGIWKNYVEIPYQELEILPSGVYNYTCFVKDISGAMNQSTIFVKINLYPYYSDLKFPNNDVYNPDIPYIFNCSWYDDDGSIQAVKFEFESVNYSVYNKYANEFSYDLKGLKANKNGYRFRWHAMDNDGAWTSTGLQTFIIHKNITQLRILFNGTENSYFDAFNPYINITIFNLNKTPGILQLYINNELKEEEIDNLLIYISQFPNGVHNITAILIDENYTGYAMLWLSITELTPPEIIFDYSDFYIAPFKPEYFHEYLNLTCTIYDSSPISWVYCCENSSGYFINQSMINVGNRNWTININISRLDWNDIITFYFYANDTWGNIGKENNSSMLYRVKICDFQTPSSKILFIPHSGTNIVNKSTLFSIIANDNQGSGISETFYSINNSHWISYTKPFDLSDFNSGTYFISFYSIDNAGNIEEIRSITIILTETSDNGDIDQRTKRIQGFNLVLLLLSIITISFYYLLKKYKKLI